MSLVSWRDTERIQQSIFVVCLNLNAQIRILPILQSNVGFKYMHGRQF